MKMKLSTAIGLSVLIIVVFFSCMTRGADRAGTRDDRPLLSNRFIETPPDTQDIATTLAEGFMRANGVTSAKSKATPKMGKTVKVTSTNDTKVISILPRDMSMVFREMGTNGCEAAIVWDKTTVQEDMVFVRHLTRPPEFTCIAYKGNDKIWFAVDSCKGDRWDDFLQFCLSSEGQLLIDRSDTGFKSLPFNERARHD